MTLENGSGSGALEKNEEESPTAQPSAELEEDMVRVAEHEGRRPVITHLNADTSWLFSIPYPDAEKEKERGEGNGEGRKYFHILVDPWFKGGQSDVAPFFSQQWHVEESFVQSVGEVSSVIQKLEDGTFLEEGKVKHEHGDISNQSSREKRENKIDLILISHEFTDHMHKETLLEAHPCIPVLATGKAASIIRAWEHFEKVGYIERFTGDWRINTKGVGVEWLGVSRVAYEGTDLLYYHSALMVSFPKGEDQTEAEAILYTPHGITPQNLTPLLSASPKIQVLALLHGLQDIKLGAQLNMGAHNGLKVFRLLKTKYWVGTHDEVKKGGGIVGWFLRRKGIGVQEAVERERIEGFGTGEELGDVRFEEVGNGGFLVLQ